MADLSDARGAREGTRGAAAGIVAAALFGMSAPLAQRLLVDVRPQLLAGLLYLGAGVALTLARWVRPARGGEARLGKSDAPALIGVVIAGGGVGPVLMLLGLERVDALVGSLLLNLEGVLTIALAVAFFGDHLGRHAALATAAILGGALVLNLPGAGAAGASGAGHAWGVVAIAGACAAWGLDNNLTQRLSLKDPLAIVRIKALAAGAVNLVLGLALGADMPAAGVVVAALALGAVSYGVSATLDAYALRLIGAVREAAYFATGPFFGALIAMVALGIAPTLADGLAMALMALGVALLLRERHGHLHHHHALAHEHRHRHDAHHQHAHAPGDPVGEPHSHPHRHDEIEHAHAHVPDLHHRHRH